MEIPKEVKLIQDKLTKAGFEAYLVGGCVRDLLLKTVYGEPVEPQYWDITTNAKPEELMKLFPDSVYENQFGTVGAKTRSEDPITRLVEITTFRKEGKYTDKRHPDTIAFAETLEEDLSRRDFIVNALAMDIKGNITDPFGGQKDLKAKVIRAVGNPEERFQEDALRLMRAVRFSAQLNFSIEVKTAEAVKKHAGLLEFIAKERIADEVLKLLMTERAADGVVKMSELGLLKYVLPELAEGIDMEQNKHHKYTVFEHNLRSLEYAAKQNFPLDIRLSALLHDVGKPRTRVWKNDPRGEKTLKGKKGDWTFYQHQYVGEKMALRMLDRLRLPCKLTEKIALLVREHMFVYDPELVTERGVRRLLRRVGSENMDDLMLVREADRIGSGVAKAVPYRLRHLKAMIERVKKDPVSVKMLAVKGNDVMETLKIEPGPKVGKILNILLEEVLDSPVLNDRDKLVVRVRELAKLPEKELDKMTELAKLKAVEEQKCTEEEIMKKFFVK